VDFDNGKKIDILAESALDEFFSNFMIQVRKLDAKQQI
jgi:hypothetical protein